MSNLEIVKLVLDGITAVAAGAAVIAAWFGVSTWRAQLAGTAAHDVSRMVLRALYRLQWQLDAARHSALFQGEGADRVRAPEEQPREAETRNLAHAYRKRLQLVLDARMELQLAELDALALWGEPAAEILQPFHRLTNKLAMAHTFFFAEMVRGSRGERGMPPERYARYEDIVWHGPAETDTFAAELQQAVSAAVDYFRGFMVRGSTRRAPATTPQASES